MDLLKALKRTTILSAMAVLAFGATEAGAASNVAYQGHVNCSITALLTVAEVSQINFGNLTIGAGATANSDTLTLGLDGSRVKTGANIVLLEGTGGIVAGSGIQDTGAGANGVYSIVTGNEGPTQVYVNFANDTGQIMDANHGEVAPNTTLSPDNVVMTNGTDSLNVDHFTIKSVTTQSGGATTYGGAVPVAHDGETYAQYVTCTGASNSCFVRVGATMHSQVPASGAYSVGHYTGTFWIMVSY
jgi:hypothetical protein